ncbi:MAG: two-component sensor histidine kinase, partial [Bacteroidetes bacterium]|nr:two-component sensor histidine kinase [Bacteroidota bacterium]
MNDKRYKWILYVIVFVILGTITIQVYWNYKNYLVNKQQFVIDVQVSLDNAVENYYANLAEKSTIGFVIEATSEENFFGDNGKFDSIMMRLDVSKKGFRGIDSINTGINDNSIRFFKGIKADSLLKTIQNDHNIRAPKNSDVEIKKHLFSKNDSL